MQFILYLKGGGGNVSIVFNIFLETLLVTIACILYLWLNNYVSRYFISSILPFPACEQGSVWAEIPAYTRITIQYIGSGLQVGVWLKCTKRISRGVLFRCPSSFHTFNVRWRPPNVVRYQCYHLHSTFLAFTIF